MKAWQIGIIGALIALALGIFSGFNLAIDRGIEDAHDRLRAIANTRKPYPSQILVIGVDDATRTQLQRNTSLPRRYYADLLDRLRFAKAVGLDFIFSAPDDSNPENDKLLAAAIRRHGRVVLAAYEKRETVMMTAETQADAKSVTLMLPDSPLPFREAIVENDWKESLVNPMALEPPLPRLRNEAAALGYVNVNADGDNVYRQPALLKQTNDTGKVLPHLSLAVAALATDTPLKDLIANAPDELRFRNGRRVMLGSHGTLILQPIGRRGNNFFKGIGAQIPYLSLADALKEDPEKFRNKIILIGETSTGTSDIRATALDNGLRGVELNADMVANLLYVPAKHPAGALLPWLLYALSVAFPLCLYTFLSPRRATLAMLAVTIGFAALLEFLFWGALVVVPWSWVIVGLTSTTLLTGLLRLTVEAQQRQRLRGAFAQYVAPEMVEELVQDPEALTRGVERMHCAILFSDIRGFTTFTEQNDQNLVLTMMEEYLSAMTAVIFEERGFLDKFIGDEIMALFGPFDGGEGEEAARALRCALVMQERLDELNVRWKAQNRPEFHVGVGIHVGEVLFGNIRTPQRTTMTALGDAVNLASRLQNLNKELKTELLISEEVRTEAEAVLGTPVVYNYQGEQSVRGRVTPVRVYSVRPAKTD